MSGTVSNFNDFPDGTAFGQITVGGATATDSSSYIFGGNRILITNGLVSTGPLVTDPNISATFDCGFSLSNNQTFSVAAPITFNGSLDLGGRTLILDNSSAVTLGGFVTDSVPTFPTIVKTNSGTFTISSGGEIQDPMKVIAVEISQGMLQMNGTAANTLFIANGGSIVLDGVVRQEENQASNSVVSGTGFAATLDGAGSFIPGDGGNPGVLSCDNFDFTLFVVPPSCVLDIKINSKTPGTGYSQLLVSNAYVLSRGAPNNSSAVLEVEMNYASQIGDSFLILRQFFTNAYNPDPNSGNGFFAGQPPGSIYDTTNGDSLGMTYDTNGISLTTIRIPGSPFVLWKGSGDTTNLVYGNRRWTSTNNWAQGLVPTDGGQIVIGPYEFSLFNSPLPPMTNDLPVTTSFGSLSFNSPNHVLYGNALTLTDGITNTADTGTNFCHLDLVTLDSLSIEVDGGGTLLLDKSFNGGGTVTKEGAGRLVYLGTTMDSFAGNVVVDDGTMQMDGSFTDGSFTVNGGLLKGTGTVSSVTLNGGTIKPGDSPGILHMQGDLTMSAGAVFEAELNGPTPGGGYGQLQVSGMVNLNGATLNLQPGFVVTPGTSFLIIANNGTGTVAGTFAGLPEGAIFQAGGQYFSITYKAGFHTNIVMVTAVNPPGNFVRITPINATTVQLMGSGASNITYTIQANTNLATTNWSSVGTATANGSGIFFFNDTNTALFPQRFFRVQTP